MLSERSRTQKDKYCMSSLTCRLRKSQSQKHRVEQWLSGAGGAGKQRDVGQRVQSFHYAE